MKNFICINWRKIELPEDVARQILEAESGSGKLLAEYAAGDVVKIACHEMIVLEHFADGTTALIRKDLLLDCGSFGSNNDFRGSDMLAVCGSFADEIAAEIGEESIVPHDVDLTTLDGLEDYGKAENCRASLLTLEQLRRYRKILDRFKPDRWWWMATPHSTKAHDNDRWVLCVSPSGFVCGDYCGVGVNGARPFLILKSTIFVSA